MPSPQEAKTGSPHHGGGWREVTLARYRRYTTVSSLLGVALLAWGLWQLAHTHLISGVLLVVAGFAAGLWTVLLRIEGTPAPLYGPKPAQREQWAPRVLHFYTRRECTLCDEARQRLEPVMQSKGITIVAHDVDKDPVLEKRYGPRVPVAVYEGDEVFALQFDEEAVRVLR